MHGLLGDKEMRVITCTGYGTTGSSAATDFFSEFENVCIVPHTFECTFIHEAGGLYDLEKAVEEGHRFKVDYAVHKFLNLCSFLQKKEYGKFFNSLFFKITKDFVENTFVCCWHGWWHRSAEASPKTLKNRLLYERAKIHYDTLQKNKDYALYEADTWMPSYQPYTNQYYLCDVKKFRNAAKKYVSQLMRELNVNNSDFLLVDQLLPPIKPELYLHYFDDIKVIVVDKDPRDYFLANKLFWGERYIPTDVDKYIYFYSQTRGAKINSEYVKYINFEELIYKYEEISNVLIKFAGLNSNWHKKNRTFFIPEKSKKNTMIFLRYSNYSEEMGKLERELSSYLFDFSGLEDEFEQLQQKYEYPIVDDIFFCDRIVENGYLNPLFIPVIAIKFVVTKLRRFFYG